MIRTELKQKIISTPSKHAFKILLIYIHSLNSSATKFAKNILSNKILVFSQHIFNKNNSMTFLHFTTKFTTG